MNEIKTSASLEKKEEKLASIKINYQIVEVNKENAEKEKKSKKSKGSKLLDKPATDSISNNIFSIKGKNNKNEETDNSNNLLFCILCDGKVVKIIDKPFCFSTDFKKDMKLEEVKKLVKNPFEQLQQDSEESNRKAIISILEEKLDILKYPIECINNLTETGYNDLSILLNTDKSVIENLYNTKKIEFIKYLKTMIINLGLHISSLSNLAADNLNQFDIDKIFLESESDPILKSFIDILIKHSLHS